MPDAAIRSDAFARIERLRRAETRRVVGLMSGTSLDGLDVACCELPNPVGQGARVLHGSTVPFPPDLKRRLTVDGRTMSAAELALLDVEYGRWMAKAVAEACARFGFEPDLIGVHGQTVYHEHGRTTLQIGEASYLARGLGCPVVADFRRGDVAAGGCGAPLVPKLDRLLLQRESEGVLALNLGGIANFTALPPSRSGAGLIAMDCGPANMPSDLLVARMTGGGAAHDEGGALASSGTVDAALLAELRRDPFFALPPPRSCGREEYGQGFVERLVERRRPDSSADWRDLLATANELAAWAVGKAVSVYVRPRFAVAEALVSGGGARNADLMSRLRRRLAPTIVRPSGEVGLSADYKEALAFAVLAVLFVDGRSGNEPGATGAERAVPLGKLVLP